MTQPKFSALKTSAAPTLDFYANVYPKCPHCGEDINPGAHDLNDLYEDGDHDIECPYCEQEFQVTANVSYTFSTDEQKVDDP